VVYKLVHIHCSEKENSIFLLCEDQTNAAKIMKKNQTTKTISHTPIYRCMQHLYINPGNNVTPHLPTEHRWQAPTCHQQYLTWQTGKLNITNTPNILYVFDHSLFWYTPYFSPKLFFVSLIFPTGDIFRECFNSLFSTGKCKFKNGLFIFLYHFICQNIF